ncbi:MAG: 4Fe-4S binding protein [Holosporaceae bacterium]|nr:4Fe-4S binding protein [Holosporaceae bacterium]
MRIVLEKCKKCLSCVEVCPVKAISQQGDEVVINKKECLECGCCASSCPNDAIEYE